MYDVRVLRVINNVLSRQHFEFVKKHMIVDMFSLKINLQFIWMKVCFLQQRFGVTVGSRLSNYSSPKCGIRNITNKSNFSLFPISDE